MAGTSICKSVDIIFSRVINLPMDDPDLPNIKGIAKIPPLSIGDDSSLIGALEETPLTGWKTKIDALPQQFSNAALAAAKLLEPETQNIKLTSGTLKTEADVTTWINRTELELLERLENGPIVIS